MHSDDARKQNAAQAAGSNSATDKKDTTGAEVAGTTVTVDAQRGGHGEPRDEPGLSLPKAGESGIGAAGASGQTDDDENVDDASSPEMTRKVFGVSGQDTTRGGLPPS